MKELLELIAAFAVYHELGEGYRNGVLDKLRPFTEKYFPPAPSELDANGNKYHRKGNILFVSLGGGEFKRVEAKNVCQLLKDLPRLLPQLEFKIPIKLDA